VDAVAAVSRQRVRDALQPVVTAAGYDLEDVSVTAAGRRSVIRIIVDRDGAVDLDAVADISRTVSDALDESDVMGASPYVLEVSSPGVDRPLTEPRHWRRAIGHLVRVSVTGTGPLTGRVAAADEDKVTLEADGDARAVSYEDLGAGHVEVEFAREDGPR
jgi:ribosome maturation factor RimP